MWRQLALAVFVSVLPLLPTSQPAAIGQHDLVTNIKMTHVIDQQVVKMKWDTVATAKRYRIRIFQGSTLIAKKFVFKPSAKFKETKFVDYGTYTVSVRAKGNANYTANQWSNYTFIYQDTDHDNDLISDAEDFDDDNDGIPDVLDGDPDGVSGTVHSIVIENNALLNGTITIKQNDTVTWVNKDADRDHAVAANNNSWFSEPLQRNESYSHVFKDPGVFIYYDPTAIPLVAHLIGTITVLPQ